MQKIVPNLWFDSQAEEAAKFYTSIFRNSRVNKMTRYGDAGAKASGRPKGSVMTVAFELDGGEYIGLNGGPHFKFSEAVSLMVKCKDQAEIDYFWGKLQEGGGREQPCGWLKDKYGLSWQIVPQILEEMILDKDPQRAERVMAALMDMTKIDLAKLKAAYEQ